MYIHKITLKILNTFEYIVYLQHNIKNADTFTQTHKTTPVKSYYHSLV
jgi:hypothetical protein